MHKIMVITKESDVPTGYVKLKDLETEHGSNTARRILRTTHSGKIRAVKLMRSSEDKGGPIWVCGEDVIAYLKECEKPQAAQTVDTQNQKQQSDHEGRQNPAEPDVLAEIQKIATGQQQIIEKLSYLEREWRGTGEQTTNPPSGTSMGKY